MRLTSHPLSLSLSLSHCLWVDDETTTTTTTTEEQLMVIFNIWKENKHKTGPIFRSFVLSFFFNNNNKKNNNVWTLEEEEVEEEGNHQ